MNHVRRYQTGHLRPFPLAFGLYSTLLVGLASAQTPAPVPTSPPETHYLPAPSFDVSAMDPAIDPCNDFYKFACGNYAAKNPIPADQTGTNQFHSIYNVDNQELNEILKKYAAPGASRTPNEQKIGDYYAACMNLNLIEKNGLTPLQPVLDRIAQVTPSGLLHLAGELQRDGVNVFFGFSELQDLKDSSKQVALVVQGGLGLPERDYYTRTGDKDKQIRNQYIAHITNMLTLAGEAPSQAATDAANILVFETKLATVSLPVTEMRDLDTLYHPQSLVDFEASIRPFSLGPFLDGIRAPKDLPGPSGPNSLINLTPNFFPAMVQTIHDTDIQTLRAYMRFRLLTSFASDLPKRFDEENFDFYSRKLEGQAQQRPHWKRCSSGVDGALGEALGQVWAERYFTADSKAKTLEMVHDVEAAMDRDIDTLDWMGPETKTKAKEKLHAVTNKIGYPDRWRDYSRLPISPTDYVGDDLRANAFENDRQLAKIGQPVDKGEWTMTPPTVNAYYYSLQNNINFPAGILQPAFYDPKADLAVNYGHIGVVIGHELTHGFDDQGRKFDAIGNLTDWWTPEDKAKFQTKTSCLVNEYGSFVAVDDVHVNGKLTLGENTADNGGLVLAYMAYLDRAKELGLDISAKMDGFTGPQRFYVAYAQNWCENSRPEQVRNQVLTDPHSPGHFRANGAIVNQPGFAPAFGCKVGTPMVPANNCRVW
jgi:putative endopeptidase